MNKVICILCITVMVVLSGCTVSEDETIDGLDEAYKVAIKYAMESTDNAALDKEYIALPKDFLLHITEEEKQLLSESLSEYYDIEFVLISSREDLIEKGYEIKSDVFVESKGASIEIESVQASKRKVKLIVGVGYASLGGEGYQLTLKYSDGQWIVTKSEIAWVS